MRRIERRAIWTALGVGAIAGLVAAVCELTVAKEGGPLPEPWMRMAVTGAINGAVTVVEIGYLYWVSLRAVHELALVAGVSFDHDHTEGKRLVHALARAALEVPNPTHAVEGIDPRLEASPILVVAATIIYKLKVGVTNFIVKAIVRRLLGRFGLRYASMFVAVPVVAAWNAIVIYNVLHEARVRAMGPSAVRVFSDLLLQEQVPDEDAQALMFQAVAACVVQSKDMHPNAHALIEELVKRFGQRPSVGTAPSDFLGNLQEASVENRRLGLTTLCMTAILDGRLSRHDKRIVKRAFAAAGEQAPIKALKNLSKRFQHGDPITREDLEVLWNGGHPSPA